MQKIVKSFSKFLLFPFSFIYLVVLNQTTSSTHRPTQLMIAAHNCHNIFFLIIVYFNSYTFEFPKLQYLFSKSHRKMRDMLCTSSNYYCSCSCYCYNTSKYLPKYFLWQYGLWSFQTGDTILERFLPKNQPRI